MVSAWVFPLISFTLLQPENNYNFACYTNLFTVNKNCLTIYDGFVKNKIQIKCRHHSYTIYYIILLYPIVLKF